MARPSFVERLLPPYLFEDADVALEDFFELRTRVGKPIRWRRLTALALYFRVIASYQCGRLLDYLNAVPERGTYEDLPVHFTPIGGPLPGDRIVGIVTPGQEITVYPIHSWALAQFDHEPERWLDVRWNLLSELPHRFPVQINVHSVNVPGAFAQITQVIEERDCDIDNVYFSRTSPDFAELIFDLSVYNRDQLNSLLSQLRALGVVAGAERLDVTDLKVRPSQKLVP